MELWQVLSLWVRVNLEEISQSSRTGDSPSDDLVSYPEYLLGEGFTPLQRWGWHILQPQLGRKVIVILNVVVALEMVLEELEIRRRIKTIQLKAFLKSARILRRVLETWGDLLSLQWGTTSKNCYEKLKRYEIRVK